MPSARLGRKLDRSRKPRRFSTLGQSSTGSASTKDRTPMKTRLLASVFALALFCSGLRADTPAPGYSVQTAPSPAFAAPMVTLPGGDFVTFDGVNVDRWTPQ